MGLTGRSYTPSLLFGRGSRGGSQTPRVGIEMGQEVRGCGRKEDSGLGLTQSWVQIRILPPAGVGWPGKLLHGLPWWLSGKESACKCRRCRFNPWVRKIPWKRRWQPTLVFLPGKSHGQRSLVGHSPWGHKKELDMT